MNRLRRLGALVLILLALLGGPRPVCAAPAAQGPVPTAQPPSTSQPPNRTRLAAPAGCLANFMTFVKEALSSRRGMVQLATIGMCIGLFIMMRK